MGCRGKLKAKYPEKVEAWTTALKEVTSKTGWRGQLCAAGYGTL